MNNLIIVEFSLSQKCFHKHSIQDMVQRNLESVISRQQSDYIPIGYFLSNESADDFIKSNYESIKNYSMFISTQDETLVVE